MSMSECCNEANLITIYNDNGQVAIYPPTAFSSLTQYSVVIPGNAFQDFNGNMFPGLGLGEFVFWTGDSRPPVETGVNFTVLGLGVEATICYSLDKIVSPGRGNYVLVSVVDNTTVASTEVNSLYVTVNGSCAVITFQGVSMPANVTQLNVSLQFNGGVLIDQFGNGVYELKEHYYEVIVSSDFESSVITGNVGFTVPNATLFIANPSNTILLTTSLAVILRVPSSWITVVLSTGSRRLLEVRRLSETVKVQYTINVPTNAPPEKSLTAVQGTLVQFLSNSSRLEEPLSMMTGVSITGVTSDIPSVAVSTSTSSGPTSSNSVSFTSTRSTSAVTTPPSSSSGSAGSVTTTGFSSTGTTGSGSSSTSKVSPPASTSNSYRQLIVGLFIVLGALI